MITPETIQQAVEILAEGGMARRVILFGSYAMGTAREDSDLDFLVVEPVLTGRREEMVRPLGIPVDVMVADEANFQRWKDHPGTALYEAARTGLVMYERAGHGNPREPRGFPSSTVQNRPRFPALRKSPPTPTKVLAGSMHLFIKDFCAP